MIYFCDTLAFSHKNKREENQDTCGYLMGEGMLPNSKSKAAAFFVADGVSNSLGNVAAQRLRKGYRAVLAGLLDRCIALLEQQAQREAESLPAMDKAAFAWEIQELLRDTVLELDTLVRADSCVGTYGATVSLALVLDGNVYTANLGDSPIFLISLNSDDEPQSLRQLYQCQNEAADLPEEEALVSNLKNILSGPVLGDAPVREAIYVTETTLGQNNILLLGSDGALAVLTQQNLLRHIRENCPDGLQAINDSLFAAIRQEAAADDNYTLLGQWIRTD